MNSVSALQIQRNAKVHLQIFNTINIPIQKLTPLSSFTKFAQNIFIDRLTKNSLPLSLQCNRFAFAEADFHFSKQINRLDRLLYTLALFTLITFKISKLFRFADVFLFQCDFKSLIIPCRSDALKLCTNRLMLLLSSDSNMCLCCAVIYSWRNKLYTTANRKKERSARIPCSLDACNLFQNFTIDGKVR